MAVIGASCDPRKFGNQAVRAFRRQGHEVIPINRHESEIEGLKAYASILDVPGEIDMVTIYLPPADTLGVIGEVAEKQIQEIWLNPGADAPEVIARARELGVEPIIACSLMAIGELPWGS